MAFTNYKTWAVGDVLTAADMNTYVRDNGLYVARTVGETTLAGSSASVSVTISSFTNARRLRIYGVANHATTTNVTLGLRFNNDATAIYTYQQNIAIGTTPTWVASGSQTSVAVGVIGNEASGALWSTVDMTILDYAGSTLKMCLGTFWSPRGLNTTLMRTGSVAASWTSTAAITSVQLIAASGTLGTSSRLTLEAIQSYA